jgi:hypothetical protein
MSIQMLRNVYKHDENQQLAYTLKSIDTKLGLDTKNDVSTFLVQSIGRVPLET